MSTEEESLSFLTCHDGEVGYYTTEEALDMIMKTVSEPLEHDPVTSDLDTDTADQDEEYLPGAGSSSTSSTDSPDGGEGETLPDLSWRPKNEEIHWAPTNSVSLQFNPPGTGLTAGPTRYAVARVGELTDSFDLFFTTEITKIVTEYMMLCYCCCCCCCYSDYVHF